MFFIIIFKLNLFQNFRSLRTEIVGCGSDVEYLCKLHCIRLAFQLMFKDPNTWSWFADTGRQTLTDLLLFADKVFTFLFLYNTFFFIHNLQ